jgi:hypothetical protein
VVDVLRNGYSKTNSVAVMELKNHLNDLAGQGDRRTQDKRNHLTLVELNHLMQLSNIPVAAREPIAFLYNEYLQFRHACLTDADIEAGMEWLTYQRDYIHHILLVSNSVSGWKADRLVSAMTADRAWQEKHPATQVAQNGQNGQPEAKKRGLLG